MKPYGFLNLLGLRSQKKQFIEIGLDLASEHIIINRLADKSVSLGIGKKRINIDIYKDRFVDKNALFNFRQVLRGDSPMSMLLFDRGTDAFNLKYTITVEEAEPNDLIIGIPLKEPISMSSDDVYSLV